LLRPQIGDLHGTFRENLEETGRNWAAISRATSAQGSSVPGIEKSIANDCSRLDRRS
jgi:hypothetical protein